MNKTFPVTHSILSINSLRAELLPDYELDSVRECTLINRGLNDTHRRNQCPSTQLFTDEEKDKRGYRLATGWWCAR